MDLEILLYGMNFTSIKIKIFCSLIFICSKTNFPLLNFLLSLKTKFLIFGPIWTKFSILEHLILGPLWKISIFHPVSKMVSYNIVATRMHEIFLDSIETHIWLSRLHMKMKEWEKHFPELLSKYFKDNVISLYIPKYTENPMRLFHINIRGAYIPNFRSGKAVEASYFMH